jgi:dTMP kinase
MKRAKVISIEGTDGVGKTHSYNYIISELEKAGKKVLATREVGSPLIPICVKLRELVLDPESKISGTAMELIFGAMRVINQDYYKTVESEYDFIVSDRNSLSHLAYTDHNVSEKFTQDFYLNFLDKITTREDLVLYLHVSPEIALKRRTKRGTTDVIEMKGPEFQEKVGKSFEKYMNLLDIPVVKMDTSGTKEQVKLQLNHFIDGLLEMKK